jgi:hypothetical protein
VIVIPFVIIGAIAGFAHGLLNRQGLVVAFVKALVGCLGGLLLGIVFTLTLFRGLDL